jgi:hypothetical protein
MNRLQWSMPVLLAAGLLQACSTTAPRPQLAVTPLLRIDDARTMPTAMALQRTHAQQQQQQLQQQQQQAPVSAPEPEQAAPTLPLTPSRMELVQLGPNEYRLQYRQLPAAATATAVPASAERIQIVNGNGVRGMGERVRRLLARHGMNDIRVVNQRGHYQRATIIEYLPAQQASAEAMLAALQGHATLLPARSLPAGLMLRLVLGRDHAARLAVVAAAAANAPAPLLAMAVPHFNQE